MQAVREVAVSLQPVFDKRPELLPIFKQASAAAGRRRRRCAAAATAAAAGALAASTGRGGAARCTQACAPVQPLPSHHPTPPASLAARPLAATIPMQIAEPERVITFRVSWLDDAGNLQARWEGVGWRRGCAASAGGSACVSTRGLLKQAGHGSPPRCRSTAASACSTRRPSAPTRAACASTPRVRVGGPVWRARPCARCPVRLRCHQRLRSALHARQGGWDGPDGVVLGWVGGCAVGGPVLAASTAQRPVRHSAPICACGAFPPLLAPCSEPFHHEVPRV